MLHVETVFLMIQELTRRDQRWPSDGYHTGSPDYQTLQPYILHSSFQQRLSALMLLEEVHEDQGHPDSCSSPPAGDG